MIAPDGFDDPDRPSGGNIYDRRICAGLAASGWDVRVATVAGSWPSCHRDARADLARIIARTPDGETVLIDGLIASAAAEQLLPHAQRLRLIVLLHMPLATAIDLHHGAATRQSERAVLGAVAGVVVTSDWTRRQVIARFPIPPDRVHVARPGVDRADEPLAGSDGVGDRLLCVGAVAPHKGQDLLIEALGRLSEVDWRCTIVGPLDRDPRFVERLRDRIVRLGIGNRVQLAGMLVGRTLDRAYANADLLVVPSRSETYGMVVTEALAHGIPVIGAAVGGLPEALGRTADGVCPGRLVTPDDPIALGAALAEWLRDAPHRRLLRGAVLRRRSTLAGWDQTVRDVEIALASVEATAQATIP
ncbi:MAG TPA: glycosyltransferase family 4 protein [Micromonosporaceae bacterium]|nr:glycosyltransferase family 4 protein [Micromonosporaceae bacterium]